MQGTKWNQCDPFTYINIMLNITVVEDGKMTTGKTQCAGENVKGLSINGENRTKRLSLRQFRLLVGHFVLHEQL